MNELKKKIGPLELWQWLALGAAAGAALLILHKKGGGEAKEVNPEEEEKLLGALARSGGGGGETGGGGSSGGVGAEPAAVAAPIPGEPGPQGPQGESVNLTPLENQIGHVEQELAENHPAAAQAKTTAPAAKNQGLVKNPANGEAYKTVHEKGKTYHVYPGRKGANAKILVGGAKSESTGKDAKRKPAKRPKPVPIHKRVTVHKPAAKHAVRTPVRHVVKAKPKPKARKRR